MGYHLTDRDETVQDIAVQDITVGGITVQDITVGGITVQDITVQDITVQDITVQDITVQGITERYIKEQYTKVLDITEHSITKRTSLPNSDEINNILRFKGHRAIVWYALRCSLRIIPIMGYNSFDRIWTDTNNFVNYIYPIIHTNFLIYKWLIGEVDEHYLMAYEHRLKNAAYYACRNGAAAYATICALRVVHLKNELSEAVLAAAEASAFAPSYTSGYAVQAVINSTISDFLFLIEESNSVDSIVSVDIWNGERSSEITKCHDQLLSQISEIGLGFLIPDMESLLAGCLNERDIEKYLNYVSNTEVFTADNLKEVLYRKSSYDEMDDNYAVRVILLGPGGAGKSSLAELLYTGEVTTSHMPTIGVNYQQHDSLDILIHGYLIENNEIYKKMSLLDLYLWDFGGQAIFHGLHHAFMHENCVYVLVVDSRHEQAPEQWLHQIKEVTNNQGKVILVTNWFDKIERRQNRAALIRRFPQLLDEKSFFDFSCIEIKSPGFKSFLNQLVSDCLNSTRKVFHQTRIAFDLIKDKYKSQNFLLRRELLIELQQLLPNESDEGIKHLIFKLSEFGRFVSVSSTDSSLCIKPEWIIDKAYQLLYHSNTLEKKGLVNTDDVADIIELTNEDIQEELASKILDFMVNQKVAVCMSKMEGDVSCFFIPDAAAIDEPHCVDLLLQGESNLIFSYELKFQPIGLRARFVAHIMANEEVKVSVTEVWRDGIIVRSLKTDDCVVVEYQQQNINVTLAGDVQKTTHLLNIIDLLLEKSANRKAIGFLTCSNKDYTVANELGLTLNPDLDILDKYKQLQQYSHCTFVNKSVDNSNFISQSRIEDSAFGDDATTKSGNRDSFNRVI